MAEMDPALKRKLICALDTGSLEEAKDQIARLKDYVGAFKIGHALTLPHGLGVIDELREAGADRIFLDLKFHDIPNSVALGVREAAKHGVWMMTLHLSGGPAMITAAVEEARMFGDVSRPMLVGVSVLTSLNEHMLRDHLGVDRTVIDHMTYLSRLGVECGLDGVVSSVDECHKIRLAVGTNGVIVVPGIRPPSGDAQDQVRIGDARTAIDQGANYLVIGRALTAKEDPVEALQNLGIQVNA